MPLNVHDPRHHSQRVPRPGSCHQQRMQLHFIRTPVRLWEITIMCFMSLSWGDFPAILEETISCQAA